MSWANSSSNFACSSRELSSLQNTEKEAAGAIRDVDTEVMLELRVVQSERLDVLSLEEGAVLQKESKENKAECKAKQD